MRARDVGGGGNPRIDAIPPHPMDRFDGLILRLSREVDPARVDEVDAETCASVASARASDV